MSALQSPNIAHAGEDPSPETMRKGALIAAIAAAELSTDGRAFEAEIDDDGCACAFEVAIVDASGVQEVSLDLDGEIAAAEPAGLLSRFFAGAPDLFAGVERSLAEAVAAVEAEIDGFAFAAELEFEDNRPLYEVEVMDRDGVALEARVDGVTGRILSIDAKND
ncbi:MAG: PepSY domain-containing protein [Pseudomonadota bacterium]